MELYLNNVSSGYKSYIIKNQNLSIKKNSWNFIIGETGSGKSTLLQTMGGLLSLKSGQILWKNEDIKNKVILKKFRDSVGFMFQYTDKQFFNSSVKDEIIYTLKRKKFSSEEIDNSLNRVINLLNLPIDILNKHPYEISGGEKRFVALASILIEQPSILFLDEPTCGLDIKNKTLFYQILKKLKDNGVTIVQISHILDDVLRYGDNAIFMKCGKIQKIGNPKIVLDNMESETLEIFKILKKFGMNTDSFKNIDDMLKKVGDKNFVK